MRIFVSNLPMRMSEQDVEKMFANYGRVGSVNLESAGGDKFGYVDMPARDQAMNAIQAIDGLPLDGKNVIAYEASSERMPT